jgi:hypothetical protein
MPASRRADQSLIDRIVEQRIAVCPTLRALANLGLTNTEAPRAATSVAARACNAADREATLAVACDADIVAVPSNPSANLRTLHDGPAVMPGQVRIAVRPKGRSRSR